MRKNIKILLFFMYSVSVLPKTDISRVLYFNQLFGHVHKSPSRYSQSLSTVECGHPIKIVKENGKEVLTGDFVKVSVGPYIGHVNLLYLSSKKEKCISDKYPKFFNSLELSITDMFYWGKLNDQYVQGKTKVQ